MRSATSRVTAQGQVSVPAEIRRRLGIGPGALLEWEIEGGHVIVRRAGHFVSSDIHRAIFATPPAARPLAELKQGIRAHMKRRHARH
jgi:AbrB family looped-hinge helix DNA binding protein